MTLKWRDINIESPTHLTVIIVVDPFEHIGLMLSSDIYAEDISGQLIIKLCKHVEDCEGQQFIISHWLYLHELPLPVLEQALT